MPLDKEGKKELFAKFGGSDTNTGSTEVQVALLTFASTSSPSTCGCTSTTITAAVGC